MFDKRFGDSQSAAQRPAEQRNIVEIIADQIVTMILQIRPDSSLVDKSLYAMFLKMPRIEFDGSRRPVWDSTSTQVARATR